MRANAPDKKKGKNRQSQNADPPANDRSSGNACSQSSNGCHLGNDNEDGKLQRDMIGKRRSVFLLSWTQASPEKRREKSCVKRKGEKTWRCVVHGVLILLHVQHRCNVLGADAKRTREETARKYNDRFITSIILSMSLCSIIRGAMGIIFSILLDQTEE